MEKSTSEKVAGSYPSCPDDVNFMPCDQVGSSASVAASVLVDNAGRECALRADERRHASTPALLQLCHDLNGGRPGLVDGID